MPERQSHDPSANREHDASITRKKVTYNDGKANMFYGRGSQVDIPAEHARLNGEDATKPQEISNVHYYAVGESGQRLYFSPAYDILIVDPHKDGLPLKIHQLNGLPPEEVVVGEPLTIPGLGGKTESIRAFSILIGDVNRPSPPTFQTDHEDSTNPMMEIMPKFEEAHKKFLAAGKRLPESLHSS